MKLVRILALLALSASAVVRAETVALQVQQAVVDKDPHTAHAVVNVTLAPESRRSLAEYTSERVGRTIHLRVDGKVLISPNLRSPIDAGELQLSPGLEGFGGKTAEEIAQRLTEGAALEISDEQ